MSKKFGLKTQISSYSPGPNRRFLKRSGMSWTDDLPICQLSDVGVAGNVMYLKNEVKNEPEPYEDYAFNFRTDDDCYLYGVFDGHDGVRAAHFAADRLPAELLLGQLNPKVPDGSIKNVLSDAFSIVERCFFESLDTDLAARTFHQTKIADSRLPVEIAAKRYPDNFKALKDLDRKIKGGTTAVIALILNNRLFVANVGNSRCLLCRLKSNGVLECQQLSKDHDLNQQDEINRLKQIGLDVNLILSKGRLGKSPCTRCIGDYSVKGGYRDIDYLSEAKCDPVTADPDIIGGIPINDDGLFMVLMSDAVYVTLQETVKSSNINHDIAKLVSHELKTKPSIEGVAQSVVDKIAYKHKQIYAQKILSTRGDLTLVVRNFSHPVGTSALIDLEVNEPGVQPVSVPFIGTPNSIEIPTGEKLPLLLVMPNTPHKVVTGVPGSAGSNISGHSSLQYTSGSTSPSDDTPTNSASFSTLKITDDIDGPNANNRHHSEVFLDDQKGDDEFYRCEAQGSLQADADGRVSSYIKLDHFTKAWQNYVALNPNDNSQSLFS